ncbi:MAG TPA: LPS export ABC transporter permease LptG [Nitrospirota bacterium]|nr:LPS export ABC transporter permease LptG [Nitrospirota bacterium]
MTLISKHILREFLGLVAGVLCGILVVYLCVEFLQKADKLIKFHASIGQVGRYFLFSIPGMITMSLPMATLIAALLSLGNLSKHNEIIAMRAGGVSLLRIVAPLIAGGIAVSLFGFVNNEFIMPDFSYRANYVRHVEIEKTQQRVMFQQQKLWLRGPNNSIANIELVSPSRTEMVGLNIFMLNPDFTFKERIIAERLVWEDNAWRLRNSRTYTRENDVVTERRSDGEIFNIVNAPNDLGMIVKDSEEMSFSELWDYVKRLKSSGYNAVQYEVDLHTKIAFPVSSLLMVLISVPFSIHKVRGGGAGKGFAIAVAIAFFYWLLMSVGESLGRSGAIPPSLAAWFANIFFGVIAAVVVVRMQRTT